MRTTKLILLPVAAAFVLSLFAASPAHAESTSASGASPSHDSVSLGALDTACETLDIIQTFCPESDPWEP